MIEETADSGQRARIQSEFGITFFVEAAAGTGKTTALVGRLVAMVRLGHGTLATTVAVTFTEKAAGEMKLRLRLEIEKARAKATGPERSRLDRALEELELARIGTIHSFCADILRERPVEAGVDPVFTLLSEKAAPALAEAAFDIWLQRTLGDMPEGVRRVFRRRSGRESAQEQLRSSLRQLCEHRDFSTEWRRDPFDRDGAIDTLLFELEELGSLAPDSSQPNSPLTRHLEAVARFVRESTRLETVGARDYDGLEAALRDLRRAKGWHHKSWANTTFGELSDTEVITRRDATKTRLDAFADASEADLAPLLHRELQGAVAEYEKQKARLGALDFLDLLIKARDLVRDNITVRRDLQDRFTHFFVDEFQDTDPLQAELLLLLAADDPAEADWRSIRPVAGKLFVVGDPKQAIYRFRRADVKLYESIKNRLRGMGAEVLNLATSFRSPPSLQTLVNTTFGPAIRADREAGGYVALEKARPEVADQPTIVALPVPEPYGKYGTITDFAISESLPGAVAAFIEWLTNRSGWKVEEAGKRVEIRPRHIAILFRRMRSYGSDVTRPYLRELEARRIPHVLVGGRSFHDREEVVALRAALAAIEWPDDELQVFATLRGPFFAIGDEALLVFLHHVMEDGTVTRRRLDPTRVPARETIDSAALEVADALDVLRRLHDGRNSRPIAQTITMFLDAVRAPAGIALWQNGEQALANCQRLVDLARSFETRASSFRAFVEELDEDAERGEADEAPIVEEGTEGVRAMTVYKAKGLDFPVVILADPTCKAVRKTASRHVDAERSLWLEPVCGCVPIELQEADDLELERDRAEGVRVGYVAATRARDLLVLPACGDQPIEGWFDVVNPVLYPDPDARRRSETVQGLSEFGEDSVRHRGSRGKVPAGGSVRPGLHRRPSDINVVWWDPATLHLDVKEIATLRHQRLIEPSSGAADTDSGRSDYLTWKGHRENTITIASRPSHSVQTVTALAAVAETVATGSWPITVERVDGHEDDRVQGRRFGALVHAVLASIPLGAGEAAVAKHAAVQSRLAGASEDEANATVHAVNRVLRHGIVARAALLDRSNVHRETPVMMKLDDGTLMEGVVDLAFLERTERGADTWTVVDFKTAREFGSERVPEEHLRQVSLYCTAIARATGVACRGVVLVI